MLLATCGAAVRKNSLRALRRRFHRSVCLYPFGMNAALQPLPLANRHPADYHDEIEHAEVARVLSALPAEHPARVAYASGAREAADSIGLTHLVADRRDMVQALTEAKMATWRRTLAQQGGYFRP